MKRIIPTAIAIAFGIVVLLDFFISHPLLDNVGAILADWAVILAAFALILGILNVLTVHMNRTIRREKGWPYGLVLVAVLLVVLILGLMPGAGGPETPAIRWLFQNVYSPLQATIFSLLAFYIVSAAYRVFRARSIEASILLVAGVIVLLGQVPVGQSIWNQLPGIKDWIMQVPATAGMRGIILGGALGAVATGLRVLLGIDRPYVER